LCGQFKLFTKKVTRDSVFTRTEVAEHIYCRLYKIYKANQIDEIIFCIIAKCNAVTELAAIADIARCPFSHSNPYESLGLIFWSAIKENILFRIIFPVTLIKHFHSNNNTDNQTIISAWLLKNIIGKNYI